MSNFPLSQDDDVSIPRIEDNITDIGGDVINSIRSAIFAVEENIGINANGSTDSISDFLRVSHNLDGTLKFSSLISLGLVALPIDNSQISASAAIDESKLNLNYSTVSLYNLFTTLNNSVDVLNGFLALIGVKVEPHIMGTDFRHTLSHIDVELSTGLVKINPIIDTPAPGTSVVNRNITNLETLAKDISDDLVIHEKADGETGVTASTGGTVPPENYAHTAAGVWIDTDNFAAIPQTSDDLQKLANFIDSSSLLLLGSRTQNLFSGGISRTSRSSSLTADGYGEELVPPTPAIAYLLNQPPGPIASSPADDIGHGDDIILFQPTAGQLSTFNFDAQFAQVQPGDLLTINYGTGVSVQFVIDSTKSIIIGSNRTYAVRINGRNLFTSSAAIARIDKSVFNRNKYHILSSGRVPNSISAYETLMVAHPRSAVALGINFNLSSINSTHFNLYLSLLPNGDTSSILHLPAIDITGNAGVSPGQYTLKNIIDATNAAFRAPGFNYRMMAFEYNGQFGLTITDPYNNPSFAIISGVVDSNGNYTSSSLASYPNNVIDNFGLIDPLGFGVLGANVASPPIATAYGSVNAAANTPSILFPSLRRNFYYVAGVEKDVLSSDPLNLEHIVDSFGDGYWPATILPAPDTQVFAGRVENVYRVNLDLSTSNLQKGKTIVVQPAISTSDVGYNFKDYGRFIIKDISYNNCNTPAAYTNITVYDGVHGNGSSPASTSTGIIVHIYFSDDGVSFDAENVADDSSAGPYKKFFEVYTDKNGHTFTHERGRFLNSGSIANINIVSISPKLRGYKTNNDKEIRLTITSYDDTTGIYSGRLTRWNSGLSINSNFGTTVVGKKGEVVRFYDETNIDYIDFSFDLNVSIGSFINGVLDIQLFKSLELNDEFMLISTCQVNDSTKKLSNLEDHRQFGNISENHLSNSALNYVTAIPRSTNQNGILGGFDNVINGLDEHTTTFVGFNYVSFNGGSALINGKIILINNYTVIIPIVREVLSPLFSSPINTIKWFICANDSGEIELIASTDFNPSLSGTYGSLDYNRIFYVKNPSLVSPVEYAIKATYFSNLLAKFRNLVPIYSVTSTVTSVSSQYVVSSMLVDDIRRFVDNGY